MKKNASLIALTVVLWLGILGPTVMAQEDAAPEAQQEEAGEAVKKKTLWDLIQTGGWAMWPLGACSFLLVGMIVVNIRVVSKRNMIPPAILGQMRTAANNRDLQTVWNLANSSQSLLTTSLAAGLRHLDPDDPAGSKTKVEDAISEAVGRQESQAGFWINFLSLISAVAPMIGLLGTVSGMIGAFQKIGAGGMGKPELLASNIGEALITTATGLTIAIPAMFAFFMFRNMLNRIMVEAEDQFSMILDSLTGTGLAAAMAQAQPQAAVPPPHPPQGYPQSVYPQQAPVQGTPPPQPMPPGPQPPPQGPPA